MNKQQGITLIEVLIALAVFAIAAFSLFDVFSTEVDVIERNKQRTLAHWVAMNVYAETQIRPKWPDVGVRRGQQTMAEQEWYWLMTVSKTSEETLRKIDIEIRKNADDESAITSLTTFIGKKP